MFERYNKNVRKKQQISKPDIKTTGKRENSIVTFHPQNMTQKNKLTKTVYEF